MRPNLVFCAPDVLVEKVDEIARREGRSRAEVLRRYVAAGVASTIGEDADIGRLRRNPRPGKKVTTAC